ncbi:MAG: hypothetical protein K0R29_2949 [Pseudobdellovibrio sp.]|nr:hypothetical protein [Pseudobdellovibrio sp.]
MKGISSVQRLLPFGEVQSNIEISADLTIRSADLIDVIFKWSDPHNKIVFSDEPSNSRQMGLWQQTCFEVFIQPSGAKKYFEINLTSKKAWNVFSFDDYRMPQPPREVQGAELVSFNMNGTEIRASFKLPGADLKKINISFCSVVVLKDAGVTYWSVKHADTKPNFHHFGSFITERTTS